MKLKIKLIYIISTFLISLSFICIGFSTWNILVKDELNIPVTIDKVINSSDYIYLDTTKGDIDATTNKHTGKEMFKYTQSSYIDSNGYETDRTTMKVYFKLDVNKCKQIFNSTAPLKLNFTIKYDSNITGIPNIFMKDGDYRNFTHKIEVSNNLIFKQSPVIVKNYYYVIPIEFTDILNSNLSTIDFVVTYNLFCQTGKYFTDNIYNVLYANNIENKLLLECLLTGNVKE